jgi:hypothetical protein
MERKPPVRRGIKNSEMRLNATPESTHIKLSAQETNRLRASTTQIPPDLKSQLNPKLAPVPVLTNRARRQAKKRFTKSKQAPSGTVLLYSVRSFINGNPQVPDSVIYQQKIVNELALKTFKKGYNRLSSSEKSKVFEILNESAKSSKNQSDTIH